MAKKNQNLIETLTRGLIKIISETNGIYLNETLELLSFSYLIKESVAAQNAVNEFRQLLANYHNNQVVDLQTLLDHPISSAFFNFFKTFPIPYQEEHIHLTGSLSAEFVYPRLQELLNGPHSALYQQKIVQVYGPSALPIDSEEKLIQLITIKDGDDFNHYLKMLLIPKLILNTRQAHAQAAYHLASELYTKYNVGSIRLKFTLSRDTQISDEQIPFLEHLTPEDVVLGLYQGFMEFQGKYPFFRFVLSPSFRKEANFYDQSKYGNKEEHFLGQVELLLAMLQKYPYLASVLKEIDTVGNEKELFRKKHFQQMRKGLRKLQYTGLKIRSHHGETWHTLKQGVQAVDNAMNIWHIDTLEHGLALGINPNYYFHRLFQEVSRKNKKGIPITKDHKEYLELLDLEWEMERKMILEKILLGDPLNKEEELGFLKTKFFSSREVEHYQHDVLNRMIHKNVSLVALPSSNMKLTGHFADYKIHPFTWWEKKGVQLGIGTDNYIALGTNYIQELLILLYSDPQNLKITKLLMVATGENRRPYVGHLLWSMRKNLST